MSAIGDKHDLQAVVDAVFQGALKTAEHAHNEGQLVGGPRYWAMSVAENVKIELLKRGLFVSFDAPPETPPTPDPRDWETREAEARVKRYGSTMHVKDSEEYERIKPLVPRDEPSFKQLADENKAKGGCGCAPGTVICPH